ncbi:MAG: DEAD/DEAH box helicase [Acidobacteriota bacterium]|nr:DEAD/DEAH box helicase [Acidobacteriota bacterium]
MIDSDTLSGLVSPALLDEARNALDILSVSNYKFDARGRLEGAVKPAPPSTVPASYARITRKGKRYRADCRAHGKDKWCIHSVILVLHHLGYKPEIKLPEAFGKKPETPRTGFRRQVSFSPAGGAFSLISLAANRPVHNPLGFMLREGKANGLSPAAMELIEDLAEEHGNHFAVGRLDLARLLSQLEGVTFYRKDGEPWERKTHKGAFPKVDVRIEGETITTRMPDDLEAGAVFLPGWPGYLVNGNCLIRYTGHVPDLQKLTGKTSIPLTAEALEPLLREKHGLNWVGPKPILVHTDIQPALDLRPRGRDLEGRLGCWYDGVFLPLSDLENRAQLIRQQGKLYLLIRERHELNKITLDSRAMRLPWRDTGFVLRENQAADKLRGLQAPAHWRLDRRRADDWFGLTYKDIESNWGADGQPKYRIGEDLYDHDALLSGLLEGGHGARLPSGQTLHFDAGEVLKNESLMHGVRELHQDVEARGNLLARLTGAEVVEEIEPPPLDDRWSEILRPYQSEGVNWLLTNHARNEPALLADDMGLGKTVQTLAYLDSVRDDRPQLIVVPTSLIMNWREECRRFSPHRKMTLHHGPNRAKDMEELTGADLIVTSYGTLRRDIDLFYDICFQVAVLDEAQAIKNAASQISLAVAELWCDHRLALTGTPVENRLTELWAIFRFLAPCYLGEEEEMRTITIPGTPRFEALKLKVAPFLKRRLKSQVEKDLPEKQEITVRLPLEEDQARLYGAVLKQSRAERDSLKKQNTMSILTKLLRLRQACCHPGLLDPMRLTAPSNKFAFLLENLTEVVQEGHAALVFSQFTSLLGILKYMLEEQDIDYLYLDGSTRNRQDLVGRFQDGAAPVFLISLKAGGTGLNLTRASYVYHLDPWWNPMVEAQATDRAHRIGQTRTVISYKLISEGTIEEKILQLQAGKRHLAEGLWGDGETGTGLDRDTLLSLLD